VELDELVTKIINHIDDTKKDTIREVKSLIDESAARTKTEIMREVNVLLEHQRDTIIKFADTRASAIEDRLTAAEDRLGEQQLIMTNKLTDLDKKISELDREFEFQTKRGK
jgi:vacuolar-type H+-ATPase subunit E/Vma4